MKLSVSKRPKHETLHSTSSMVKSAVSDHPPFRLTFAHLSPRLYPLGDLGVSLGISGSLAALSIQHLHSAHSRIASLRAFALEFAPCISILTLATELTHSVDKECLRPALCAHRPFATRRGQTGKRCSEVLQRQASACVCCGGIKLPLAKHNLMSTLAFLCQLLTTRCFGHSRSWPTIFGVVLISSRSPAPRHAAVLAEIINGDTKVYPKSSKHQKKTAK